MEKLKGALLFGQSGGPSSVINSSACGVFEEAFKQDCITAVYGAAHGIKGILEDRIYDIGQEDREEISLLKNTPSSALGSVRYKLKNSSDDESDYKKLLATFKKYNIRYFMYNGGNDSMDTCCKVGKYMREQGYDCRIIGVPKTVDNDLMGTDHCPGFGSAAKYIATTCMEIALDSVVYDKGTATVIEIMGRNAGWLTASSAVASYAGAGPDLIYLPERTFDIEEFLTQCTNVFKEKGNVLAAVSEGIRDKSGKYIAEYATENVSKDSFNHIQLGGVGNYLGALIKERLNIKVRAIEFSLMQRCASHIASKRDVEEAYLVGAEAVKAAVKGESGIMIGLNRAAGSRYKLELMYLPLEKVANYEKKLPERYISDDNFVSKEYLDYVLPLIEGEAAPPFINGVPRFAKLKKIRAK